MKQCVLVTGGLGFIGVHVVQDLLDVGFDVRILDHNAPDSRAHHAWSDRVDFLQGDCRDRSWQETACRDMDMLIHLAWSSVPGTAQLDRPRDLQDNAVYAAQLFEVAARCGVRKVMFASSGGAVYGPYDRMVREDDLPSPISAYGVAKLTTEHYLRLCCQEHGLCGLTLRFANPYGRLESCPYREQGIIDVALSRVKKNEPIHIWGNGDVIRDFFFIEDLASAVRQLALYSSSEYEVFNIGSGMGRSINEIIEAIRGVTGVPIRVDHKAPRNFDVPMNVLDIRRINTRLGWFPKIDFAEGLRRVWAHRRDNTEVNA